MPTYDVHIYPVCRVKIEDIEAADPKEAIRKAIARLEPPRPGEFGIGEYADDIAYYFVDLQGDEDYESSQWFNDAFHLRNLLDNPTDTFGDYP